MSGAVAKLASINLRKLVLSPTGSINLGFLLREDLLLCSSYLPLGVPNWAVIYTPSRVYIDISGEMVVRPPVLFKKPTTINNCFASLTNWSSCQAVTTCKFNKTKVISKSIFIFGINKN
jgi:hypothetical protein